MAVMATQWMTLSKSVDGADPEVWNMLQDGEATPSFEELEGSTAFPRFPQRQGA